MFLTISNLLELSYHPPGCSKASHLSSLSMGSSLGFLQDLGQGLGIIQPTGGPLASTALPPLGLSSPVGLSVPLRLGANPSDHSVGFTLYARGPCFRASCSHIENQGHGAQNAALLSDTFPRPYDAPLGQAGCCQRTILPDGKDSLTSWGRR